MLNPSLYRKRFIPNEIIHLKDDKILLQNDTTIITSWLTLKPRIDIASGTSAYYIDKGLKVSKVYDQYHQIVYWYCDIIQTKIDEQNNTVIFEDLLVDVILFEDGTYQVVDLDELAQALSQGLITQSELIYALNTLHFLLHIIAKHKFKTLQDPINKAELLYSSSI